MLWTGKIGENNMKKDVAVSSKAIEIRYSVFNRQKTSDREIYVFREHKAWGWRFFAAGLQEIFSEMGEPA